MEGEGAGSSFHPPKRQQRQTVSKTEHSASFMYSPLADGCIRVLNIDELDDSNDLHCTLYNITLDKAAEYDAISYAWNDEALSVPINCNGQQLFVTSSLHEALHSIYVTGNKLLLWADAVCINQSDNNEKAIQVQMMGKIYSMATKVIVWLGPRSMSSDVAMGHFVWLYDRINMMEKKMIEQTRDPDEVLYVTQELEDVGLPIDNYIWGTIAELLSRSWFKRLWTMQEVCLARYCILRCGSRVSRWDELIALIRAIISHKLLSKIQPETQSIIAGTPFAVAYLDNIQKNIQQRIYPTLDELMQYASTRETSNPLDKVYAVLGLVDPKLVKQIKVDYSEKSREDYWRVYLRLCHLLLQGSPSLYLLSYACSKERPNSLPSWCPNFNSEQEVRHLDSGPYQAGGVVTHANQLPHIATSLDSRSIILRGAHIDMVSDIGESLWHYNSGHRPKEVFRARVAFLTECLHMTQKSPRERSQPALGEIARIPEILMRNLVGNYIRHDQSYAPSEEILGKMFHSVQKFAYRVCELGDLDDWSMSGEEIDQKDHCIKSINLTCADRRFFTTSNGRLGMGPRRIEPSDIVCVFRGVPIPLILRPEPSGAHGEEIFKLVGEAYVQGVMDGETFKAEDEGEMVSERLFTVA